MSRLLMAGAFSFYQLSTINDQRTFSLQPELSDEQQMESAWRRRDPTAAEPWHGRAPDELAMEREESRLFPDVMGERDAQLKGLMVYLFGDGEPERWERVALRAYAVVRHLVPWVAGTVVQDGLEVEVRGLRKRVRGYGLKVGGDSRGAGRPGNGPGQDAPATGAGSGLADFLSTAGAEVEVLSRLMGYLYPPVRNRRLERGTRRVYLLARVYQPWLVTAGEGGEMTYEDLARIFEGDGLATKQARAAARSRWSARAQEVVRKTIEQAGGVGTCGKSATARRKMSESARGNSNRRGRGGVE